MKEDDANLLPQIQECLYGFSSLPSAPNVTCRRCFPGCLPPTDPSFSLHIREPIVRSPQTLTYTCNSTINLQKTAAPLSDKKANKLFLLLRISGAIAVLVILFQVAEIETVRSKLIQAEWIWIFWASVITVLTPLLGSIRLKLFLEASGVVFTYWRCLQVSLCALSLNLLLPLGEAISQNCTLAKWQQGPSWNT